MCSAANTIFLCVKQELHQVKMCACLCFVSMFVLGVSCVVSWSTWVVRVGTPQKISLTPSPRSQGWACGPSFLYFSISWILMLNISKLWKLIFSFSLFLSHSFFVVLYVLDCSCKIFYPHSQLARLGMWTVCQILLFYYVEASIYFLSCWSCVNLFF